MTKALVAKKFHIPLIMIPWSNVKFLFRFGKKIQDQSLKISNESDWWNATCLKFEILISLPFHCNKRCKNYLNVKNVQSSRNTLPWKTFSIHFNLDHWLFLQCIEIPQIVEREMNETSLAKEKEKNLQQNYRKKGERKEIAFAFHVLFWFFTISRKSPWNQDFTWKLRYSQLFGLLFSWYIF